MHRISTAPLKLTKHWLQL